jgi:hypothetical protein
MFFSCSRAFRTLSFDIPVMISPHMIFCWLCFCIYCAAFAVAPERFALKKVIEKSTFSPEISLRQFEIRLTTKEF